jgi:hypothetical protein
MPGGILAEDQCIITGHPGSPIAFDHAQQEVGERENSRISQHCLINIWVQVSEFLSRKSPPSVSDSAAARCFR